MILATKGKGAEIKWVDELGTDTHQKIVKLNEEVDQLKKINSILDNKLTELYATIDKIKLENIEIVKGLISR